MCIDMQSGWSDQSFFTHEYEYVGGLDGLLITIFLMSAPAPAQQAAGAAAAAPFLHCRIAALPPHLGDRIVSDLQHQRHM